MKHLKSSAAINGRERIRS